MPGPIVLLTSGTRGDVQPMLALGLGLCQAGLAVRVAAPRGFERLVVEHGLDFIPLDGNPSDLLTRPGAQSALSYDGHALRSLRASLDYWRAARPLYGQMLASAAAQIRQAGVVVAGLPALWGAHLAEALSAPLVWAFTQPYTRTRAFSSPLLPVPLPGLMAQFSYSIVDAATWLPWQAEIRRWRASLGLRPGSPNPAGRIHAGQDPVLYGFSPLIVPPPPDWPASHQVTGCWPLSPPPGWQPSPALERFLEAGDPPLYIGFGSPGPARAARVVLGEVLEALAACGLRAVISLPGSFSTPLPEWAWGIQDVPHTWLFPRLAGVVHHGGAGTTAAALRAGLPQLIAPLAVDQFFWGSRVRALGIGPPPLPQRAWNVARLTHALDRLATDRSIQACAGRLGQALAREDGVAAAAARIQSML